MQNEIKPRGWAIECRITSEDTYNGFLPSTGRIDYLHIPSGPGVRWDGGIETGTSVGLHYDPLLAKLIVWAATRELAIERMHRALLELTIDGIETSRDFQLRLMEDGEFRRGEIEVQWLERRLPSLIEVKPPSDAVAAAAIAAALLAEGDRNRAPGGNGQRAAEGGQPGARAGYRVPRNEPQRSAVYDEGAVHGPADAWKRSARLAGLR